MSLIMFWGPDDPKYGFLSNFYGAETLGFPTSEHAFMYMKAKFFGDHESMTELRCCNRPNEAKKIGRSVKGFDEALWDMVKKDVMEHVLYNKFSKDVDLRIALLRTFPHVLVEASPYDKIWGIGLIASDPRAQNPTLWPGKNLLGKALMRVRKRLQP